MLRDYDKQTQSVASHTSPLKPTASLSQHSIAVINES